MCRIFLGHLDTALVMVAGKMLARLGFLALALALDVVHLAIHPINNGELAHLVHVLDPMHVSVLIHILSRYSHSFIVFVVCFFITLL